MMSRFNNGTLWVSVALGALLAAVLPGQQPSDARNAVQFWALADQMLIRQGKEDTAGLLFIYQTVSGQLAQAQQEEQEFGLSYSNDATGVQRHEEVLEANHDIHAYRGLTLMPDFQYVMHPNAQTNIANAVVLGVKANVNF